MPAQPLRLLHVTPYYEPAHVYGGPTYSVPLLCKAVAQEGIDVTVITTDANGDTSLDVPLATPLTCDGVTVLYFPRTLPRGSFRSPALGRACRSLLASHDIVHVTGAWTYPSWTASRASRRAGKPYVVSPRGMLMPWELQHKGWKKRPYFRLSEYPRLRESAGIHCTSPEELRAMQDLGLQETAFLVPNPLDLGAFNSMPSRGRLRAQYGIGADETVLLFVGRLHPKKGIDLTLQAFEVLAARHPKLHLMLVGPDEQDYSTTIPARARQAGLGARIHLTGQLSGDDRLSAFADADVFLLLSASENFGMSAAEGMAASLPVVVTRGVGISAWIHDGQDGKVVADDVDSVVRALEPLINSSSDRTAMGAQGRALVEQEFSPERVARSMVEEYGKVLTS